MYIYWADGWNITNFLTPLLFSLALMFAINSFEAIGAFRALLWFIFNKFKDSKKSFLIITHYQKLLDYIHPDYVHVMRNGKIVKSGDISLAAEIEASGYQNF